MSNGADILAEHYQKTFEMTLDFWEKRNRTFLILLSFVGIGTLLTFHVSQAEPMLVDYVLHVLDVKGDDRVAEIRKSFPYGLIQSIIMIVILYLMVQIYHRTTTITRSYEYLSAIEDDIRDKLSLNEESRSFTREGKFYWSSVSKSTRWIGVAYILMLGILLVAFIVMRIINDISSGSVIIVVIDIFLSLAILFFFFAYSYSSSIVVASFFRKMNSNTK
jgi:hypothetical protein